MPDRRLVLASGSPRRADLLGRFDVDFVAFPADVDETPLAGELPAAHVRRLARAKADAVDDAASIIVGADTVVDVDDRIFGKPVDRADARRMLGELSGRSHRVRTGVVVRTGAEYHCGIETTEVEMVELDPARIDWYVATGEPADKAGAYALQGRGGLFVAAVRGCVTNVIGLPLPLLDRLLTAAGCNLAERA